MNYTNYPITTVGKKVLLCEWKKVNKNPELEKPVRQLLKNLKGFKIFKTQEKNSFTYLKSVYRVKDLKKFKDFSNVAAAFYEKAANKKLAADAMVFEGKYKGIGNKSNLYAFFLVIGVDEVEELHPYKFAIALITPKDKGLDYFFREVKKALFRFNVETFNGKCNYINKCPKTVTGSTEIKPYSYKGQIITASSKAEAIQKVIAILD